MASEDVNSQTIASSEQTKQPVTSTSQQESNNKDANSTRTQSQVKRMSNIERIRQCKQQMYSWPQEKKLLKLAYYSACQAEECKCMGCKNAQPIIRSPESNIQQFIRKFSDPCELCTHSLENHIEHLRVQSDEEINRLLGMAVDVDNISLCIARAVDTDTRNAYCQLYKLLRNCILSMTKPVVESPALGQPPFERPNIANAVMNFTLYKFSHLPPRERQVMSDMAKMFLYCLEFWNFETPSAKRLTINADEALAYKINYIRWIVFCLAPAFCDSLPRYNTPLVFGKTLLQAVFRSVCNQFIETCNNERDNIPLEKRVVLTRFPKFFSLLEVEVYSDSSPIWDPEFNASAFSH